MINNNIWMELPKTAIEPLSIEILDEKSSSYKIERTFCFSKQFIGFNGHFPNNPVLPGVVQISCVRYMCSLFFNRTLKLLQIQKVKFIKVIKPNEIFKISIVIKKVNDYIQANFTITSDIIKSLQDHIEKEEIIVAKGILYLI